MGFIKSFIWVFVLLLLIVLSLIVYAVLTGNINIDGFDRADNAAVGTSNICGDWVETEKGTTTFSIDTNRLKNVEATGGIGSNVSLDCAGNFGYRNNTVYEAWNLTGWDAGAKIGIFDIYDDKGTACYSLYMHNTPSVALSDSDGSFAVWNGGSALPAAFNVSVRLTKINSVTNAIIVNLSNVTDTDEDGSAYTRNMVNLCQNFTKIETMLQYLNAGGTFYIGAITGKNGTIPSEPDTTPPEITLINLTSEGGVGQIIFNNQSLDGYITHKQNEPANLPNNARNFDGIDMNGNVLLLHFDGNSTSDYSNNGNSFTVVNGANVTPEGKISDGYMFNKSQYLNISDQSELSFTGTSPTFAFSFWVNYNAVSGGGTVGTGGEAISKVSGGGQWEYTIQASAKNGGQLTLRTWTSGGGTGPFTAFNAGNAPHSIDGWHHMVVTANGTNASGWIDGVQKWAKNPLGTSMSDTNEDFLIGVGGTPRTDYFNGTIDEVAIFNRGLTQAEITRMYQQGMGKVWRTNDTTPTFFAITNEAATCSLYVNNRINVTSNEDNLNKVLHMTFDQNASDESIYKNDGTINGAICGQNGKIKGGCEFDGMEDNINLGTDRFTSSTFGASGSGTFEAWIKTPDNVANNHIFDFEGVIYMLTNAGGTLSFCVDGICNTATSTGTVNDDSWHHVVGAWDRGAGNYVRIYIDGNLDGTATPSGSITVDSVSRAQRIGSEWSVASGRSFNGTIDEIHIYNVSLSGLEINDTRLNGLSPNHNYSLMTKLNASRECSTTGSTTHTCTAPESDSLNRIGLASGFLGCKDSSGNENITSTSGMFLANITDPIPPKVDLNNPTQDMVFKIGKNETIIFNFSATDNIDKNFTAKIVIDGIQEYFNNTYLNGTNALFIKTMAAGAHYWNITANDSFHNINSSSANFTVNDIDINITLNEHKNNSLIYSGTNIQFNFTINFTESIDKCFLYINGSRNQSNISKITTNEKYILNNTNLTINNDYSWTIGCNNSDGYLKNTTDKFNLFVNYYPNISFTFPTLKNNSVTNNLSILINVTTRGKIINYTLEWNGTNETVIFNTTLNILINKTTNLEDLTTYTYKVYANDTNGNSNSTETRTVSTNKQGLEAGISGGVSFSFRPDVLRSQTFFGNQSLTWIANNTAILLSKSNIAGNYTLYNNGSKISENGNYTINADSGTITITNSSTLFNGSDNIWITNKLNFSYNYYTGDSYLQENNISCAGQNSTIGCLNFSTSSASSDLNLTILYNITNDPRISKMMEDFTSIKNWTSLKLRSNNTNNISLVNHSILCIEMQNANESGVVQYRFNNSLELDYLNSTNESNKMNFTFNCPKQNSVYRYFNGSQMNLSGFNTFNFSWKGDNSTNTFIINLIDQSGTKTSSSSYSLENINWNYSGFSLGSVKNISIINISLTNQSGTGTLNHFFIDSLHLTNSTHNQSQYITMYASCTSSYHNATVLQPNTWTNLCILPKSIVSKFVWLFQDINAPFRGLRWRLYYNVSEVV